MSDTKWDSFGLEQVILRILESSRPSPKHPHLGRPFLSGYQVAIELKRRYPELFAQLNMPLGGQGTGQQTSLSQYIAGQLSQRIQAGKLPQVEGAWLSDQHVRKMSFAENVDSSLVGTFNLSIYRLR